VLGHGGKLHHEIASRTLDMRAVRSTFAQKKAATKFMVAAFSAVSKPAV
jgi:hypothetical protein